MGGVREVGREGSSEIEARGFRMAKERDRECRRRVRSCVVFERNGWVGHDGRKQ